MKESQLLINQLSAFKSRPKFPENDLYMNWMRFTDRQLEQCDKLISDCVDKMVLAVQTGEDSPKLKKIIREHLSSMYRVYFSVPAVNYIGSLFYELADIAEVKIDYTLDCWRYGYWFTVSTYAFSFVRPKRIKKIVTQPCTGCKTSLKTEIRKEKKGIPDQGWIIASCNVCGEYNLVAPGEGIKEMWNVNYKAVELLGAQDYTEDEARSRMDQKAYFRK